VAASNPKCKEIAVDGIIVAGHICVDIAPRLPVGAAIEPGNLLEVGPLTMTLGGCVANTGGDLAALGIPVKLSAAIGRDHLGDFVRGAFVERELDASGLQIVDRKGTSYSLVLQPDGADRTIWHYAGANALFDESLVDPSDERILHVGYPPLLRGMLADNGERLRRMFARARQAGVTTSLDMAVVDQDSETGRLDWDAILANVLPEVDVFSPSFDDVRSILQLHEGFSPLLAERASQSFIDRGVAVVSLSCGARGIHVRTADKARLLKAGSVLRDVSVDWAGKSFWQPAVEVTRMATTNGAGDAATAGLLFGLLSALCPEDAARLATACAGVKISGLATTLDAISDLAPDLARVLCAQQPG